MPRAITNELSVKERSEGVKPVGRVYMYSTCVETTREAVYQRGGVVFITSRILVVDLLRGQCPVEKVAGVLVWNAHK